MNIISSITEITDNPKHKISCVTNASTPTGVNAFFKLIFKELTPAGYAPR